jgi:exopolysaccharide production protein ExoQ
VPISVLLVKYYPDLGRGYNHFSYAQFYMGMATDKNGLGLLCLICGIGSFWQLIYLLKEPRADWRKGPIAAQVVLLLMDFWLLWNANSMTSWSCLLMACALMACASTESLMKKRWVIHAATASLIALSTVALFANVGSGLVQGLGRDPSLTGRTDVWKAVLAMPVNPVVGTGFESFWLGPRLDKMWAMYWWKPNEAHNGYIETYLDLGFIGLILLAVLLVAGYRAAIAAVRRSPEEGVLRLAFLFTAIVYNCTESAIRIMHPAWICLLLAVITLPGGWIRRKKTQAEIAAAEWPSFVPAEPEKVAVS